MIDCRKFIAQLAGEEAPRALLRLLDYQNVVGYAQYSQALTLSVGERSGLIHGWSAEPEFLSKLVPFGVANASGSFYALWNSGSTPELDQWPVVVFGDEGGEWVVARNILELFKVSTFDQEPMVDYQGVMFVKDDEWYEESKFLQDYKRWLKEQFQVEAIDDPSPLIASSQAELQKVFDAWKQPFLAWKSGSA